MVVRIGVVQGAVTHQGACGKATGIRSSRVSPHVPALRACSPSPRCTRMSCFPFFWLVQIPITLYGVLDQDVDKKLSLKYPQLYRCGQMDLYLNLKVFLKWAANGVWHAVIIFAIPMIGFAFFTIPTTTGRVSSTSFEVNARPQSASRLLSLSCALTRASPFTAYTTYLYSLGGGSCMQVVHDTPRSLSLVLRMCMYVHADVQCRRALCCQGVDTQLYCG